MAKSKIRFTDVLSALYLVFMLPWLGIILLADLMALMNAGVIIASGFSNMGLMAVVGACTLFIAPSFLIPGLRRMYYRLPWLEPLVVFIVTDSMILCIGYEILNFGYQVVDPGRHVMFIILAIIWLVVARAVQCLILKKHPIRFAGVSELT